MAFTLVELLGGVISVVSRSPGCPETSYSNDTVVLHPFDPEVNISSGVPFMLVYIVIMYVWYAPARLKPLLRPRRETRERSVTATGAILSAFNWREEGSYLSGLRFPQALCVFRLFR